MRSLIWVAVCAALAACTAPPPPPVATASAAPVSATAPVADSGGLDGVYRSPAGGAGGNSACGTTRFSFPIRVANGTASMQTVAAGRLEGTVAPDGSLLIERGRALLRGQFRGREFTGTYTNGRCSFDLAYRK